MNFRPLNIVYL